MIINKIQEYSTRLFRINRLVAYWKFLQQIIETLEIEPLEIEDRINLTMVIK